MNNAKTPNTARAVTTAYVVFGGYVLLRKGKRTYAVVRVV